MPLSISLTQLRYAVALDTHRHFGRAAAHCYVSQPTLSMQLQKLEETLGIQLFDRSRAPVEPTDLGALVIAQARVALSASERIPALVAEHEQRVAGELRLGVIPTLAPYLLPLVTVPFLDRYPEVAITVRELQTGDILAALATSDLDAGLVATDEQQPGLMSEALFDEPFVAYMGSAHPLLEQGTVDPWRVPPEDLWLLKEGHCFRDQVLDLCGQVAASSLALRFEGGNLETLRIMVEQIGGVTLLPLLATRFLTDEQQARLRPLTDPAPSRRVRLLSGGGYLRRAAVQAYGRTVREVMSGQEGVEVAIAG